MKGPRTRSIDLLVPLDPESRVPRYEQKRAGIRAAILDGRLEAGAFLPSSRALARDLGVSRTTVLEAYDFLRSEGLIVGSRGAGTRVASRGVAPSRSRGESKPRDMSLPAWLAAPTGPPRPFRVGEPAVDLFPLDLWRRLYAEQWRRISPPQLQAGDPLGCMALRAVLVEYLSRTRGIEAIPEQVIINRGTQQGYDLAARVLLTPGDAVLVEEPGYLAAREVIESREAALIPVPVDAGGMDVEAGIAVAPGARAACVTPSHQFPTGATLGAERRERLIEWANDRKAWIIEDDYDAEFRFEERPLPSLQGLDRGGRVIYLGTFSKTLFPALRMGFMIVPLDLINAFARARALADPQSSPIDQAVLGEFIGRGHLGRHIRRMRAVYQERRDALSAAARERLAPWVTMHGGTIGMHVTASLTPPLDDQQISEAAWLQGVEVTPLSRYYMTPLRRDGLVLGYACSAPAALRRAVDTLHDVISALAQ